MGWPVCVTRLQDILYIPTLPPAHPLLERQRAACWASSFFPSRHGTYITAMGVSSADEADVGIIMMVVESEVVIEKANIAFFR